MFTNFFTFTRLKYLLPFIKYDESENIFDK